MAVVTAPEQVAQAYAVRHEVFVVEQGVPVELERDERDPAADHVLATRGSRPVGAGRLVVEPAGFEGIDPALGPVGHLGRLAVLAEARGSGLGAAMVAVIEEQAAVARAEVRLPRRPDPRRPVLRTARLLRLRRGVRRRRPPAPPHVAPLDARAT